MKIKCGVRELIPTDAFKTYWYFAAERQKIHNARMRRSNQYGSDDKILQAHRFTNSYRILDRVSQYLVRDVQRGNVRKLDHENIIFRTLLFKIFNKINTWQALETAFGAVELDSFNYKHASEILMKLREQKNSIYSSAYIMPSPKMGYGFKHDNHLELLRTIFSSGISEKLSNAKSLKALYEILLSINGFGKFLAFQYAIDLNYSEIFEFPEESFVVAGPGAIDGISKCFLNWKDFSAEDIIRSMYENQDSAFDRFSLEFRGIPGHRLQPIDCQNLFCELSKYSRVSHPEISGVSQRKRIKQKYTMNPIPPKNPIFPKHWKLNSNELNAWYMSDERIIGSE